MISDGIDADNNRVAPTLFNVNLSGSVFIKFSLPDFRELRKCLEKLLLYLNMKFSAHQFRKTFCN